MGLLKIVMAKVGTILLVFIKFFSFMAVMMCGAYLLAPMGTINSKNIDMSIFSNTPNDTMMVIFNSEYFSGYLFSVTLAVVIFVVYLLWELHEIAIHKAQEKNSTHIQLVFALSLCGLFIHKAWWVLAIIIAFANWQHIGTSLTRIIKNALSTSNDKKSETLISKTVEPNK